MSPNVFNTCSPGEATISGSTPDHVHDHYRAWYDREAHSALDMEAEYRISRRSPKKAAMKLKSGIPAHDPGFVYFVFATRSSNEGSKT